MTDTRERHVAEDLDFSEFTEAAYLRVLRETKSRYQFERFGTRTGGTHVLWRHDVDFSVHRAARLAEIEHAEGVAATYFFWFHSPFYNLLERPIVELGRRIVHAHAHRLGLHFDGGFYGAPLSAEAVAEKIAKEAALLAEVFEARVEAFSFHNPGADNELAFEMDEIDGLVNVYGPSVRDRYTYVSDANGYWRFRRLLDVLDDGTEERLHVLTHPEWWQAEPMPPRARVVRCVEGRAAQTLRDYDELLAREGRLNIN